MSIKIKDDQGNILPGRISNISPQADANTRRFLIEAVLSQKIDPLIGTVVMVSVETTTLPSEDNVIILPLSAITVGQNENYIFIVENNRAKKISIEIKKISGETAEILTKNLNSEDRIIISGNKLVKEGSLVSIQ